MDIRDRARGRLNPLERVLHWLPGFKGYYERELRRDADRLLREFVSEQLRQGRERLADGIAALTRQRRLDALTPLDLLSRQLERLGSEVRYADRGYSGFFDLVKIKEADLDALYETDARLAGQAAALAEGCRELASGPLDDEKRAALLARLGEATALLAQRTETLKGYR